MRCLRRESPQRHLHSASGRGRGGEAAPWVQGATVYVRERMFWKQMNWSPNNGARVLNCIILDANFYWTWWYMPATPVPAKLRQEDTKLDDSLGYLPHPKGLTFILEVFEHKLEQTTGQRGPAAPPEQTEDPGNGGAGPSTATTVVSVARGCFLSPIQPPAHPDATSLARYSRSTVPPGQTQE